MNDTPTRRLFRVMFRLMAYRSPRVAVPPQGCTLTNVIVINPGAERQDGQTLVVEGGAITRIAPAEQPGAPEGFLLPGLADMHVHVPPPQRDLVHLLFLAHGVTTVRETGDADGSTWAARRRVQAGRVPGPRIFASGPVLDGDPPFLPTSWVVRNAAEAEDAVATLAAQGADFVKIHHKLSAEALAGIREAAARHGLRVVGHIPMSVPFAEAGVWDVQHLDGLVPYPQPPQTPLDYQKAWRDLTPAQIEGYVHTSVEQGLVHTPTLASGAAFARLADPRQPENPATRLLPRYYRDVVWNREYMPLFRTFSDETLTLMRQGVARSQEVVRRLHEAGVRLHLGTDTAGAPFAVPGASMHEELVLFADAGLTLEEAWTAGTRAAGESLGVPLLGTVQEGAPADLLVFGADPTRDSAALSTLKAVVAQGRLYTMAALDEALARHRERFERPLYDRLATALVRLGMKRMASG